MATGTRTSCGSSPRTRGTRRSASTSSSAWRFIPAHAGNTQAECIPHPVEAVHPRARGEHAGRLGRREAMSGSSPRTRGTRRASQPGPLRARFIPAHAGNTWSRCARRRGRPVHPRARGEHHHGYSAGGERGGSSPRTRGTRRRNNYRSRWRAVHPRARGEHGATLSAPAHIAGSSPRTRGTPELAAGHLVFDRFIPAHAGNTSAWLGSERPLPVHPRARGEHEVR